MPELTLELETELSRITVLGGRTAVSNIDTDENGDVCVCHDDLAADEVEQAMAENEFTKYGDLDKSAVTEHLDGKPGHVASLFTEA